MDTMIMVFLLLVGALFQSLLPAAAALGSAKVPILLGIVLYYSLTHRRGPLLWAAILAGVIQDSMSPMIPVGYSALCFVCLGLLVHEMRGVLFKDSVVTVAVLGALLSAVTTLALYFMLLLGTDTASVPLSWLALNAAGNALLGVVVGPLAWWLGGALERQVGIVHWEEA